MGLDELPDGIVVADRDGRVARFSQAAARITGMTADQVVGRVLAEALPFVDLQGRSWWACADPYHGLLTRSGHRERTLLLPGPPGGQPRETLVTARYVRSGPDREVAWVVLALRDTQARAREEISRAELVSTVAHELRSPLTSVKGFTATLLAKWDKFSDAQKLLMLSTVESDADRVTRLITELLDIARIDSHRLELHRQPVDLPVMVRRHVEGLVASGYPAERFIVEVDDPGAQLWLDSDKIDQVLSNLLDNALRHGAGTVTIRVEPDLEGVAVSVTDQGDGIAADVAGRVFTKFWRSGRRAGTGLGLYIVRGLVEAHGGRISLSRPPSGGACLRFVVPDGIPEVLRPRHE